VKQAFSNAFLLLSTPLPLHELVIHLYNEKLRKKIESYGKVEEEEMYEITMKNALEFHKRVSNQIGLDSNKGESRNVQKLKMTSNNDSGGDEWQIQGGERMDNDLLNKPTVLGRIFFIDEVFSKRREKMNMYVVEYILAKWKQEFKKNSVDNGDDNSTFVESMILMYIFLSQQYLLRILLFFFFLFSDFI
jgi:hypothetical protein